MDNTDFRVVFATKKDIRMKNTIVPILLIMQVTAGVACKLFICGTRKL